MFILSLQVSTFKQCFSPASSIQGNRLTRRMTLTLVPNPLMNLIPDDNMCKVLDNKQSVAQILLQSPANGVITLPDIPFTYHFNESISLTYRFPSLADYDKTLDVTNAGYSVLLDNEYQIQGSVSSIFHVRSNQTSCFSSSSFIYSYSGPVYIFQVEPVFCHVQNFTPFLQFLIDGVWEEIEIRPLDVGSPYYDGQTYATDVTDFQKIKYYTIDIKSNIEKVKYSNQDRKKILDVKTYFSHSKNLKVRLSLRYQVGAAFAAITNVADYKFSTDMLNCYDNSTTKAVLTEDNIMIKTGLKQLLKCLSADSAKMYYDYSQIALNSMNQVRIDIVIYTSSKDYKFSQTVPTKKFLDLPYSKFSIDNTSLRELMDYNDTVENKIQVFYLMLDKNRNYLYDFSTKPMDLMRTCIQKRVIHYFKNQTDIAVWAKNDLRCKQRTSVNHTIKFRGLTKESDGSYKIRQSQELEVVQNFTVPVNTFSVTCANDKTQSKEDCQKNREIMLRKENRKDMLYFLESTTEYNEISYYSIEYADVVWKWVGAVAGCLITVFIVVGVMLLTKYMNY
ncbi:Conserved_hypothetical protein [Hexamita inflata]|uniref:Uncharacterized protein n=1 Tax=Hexamita inflata TaxID=28002 RepID=A0AA86QM75_9EUKA|nr:Conserved hypothetical protein [Hexamita inflata]